MIAKLTGALLLILGSGYFCVGQIMQRRKEIQLRYELAAALESMEGMIRWENATLPRAIEHQCDRDECGEMFSHVLENVKGGSTLQRSWHKTFFAEESVRDILCRIELSGDETRIIGQLHLAAQQLRQTAEQCNAGRSENEKLSVAICASAVGLITILLF